MLEVIVGSLLLSLAHAAIPNHWLPLVTLAQAEKWSRSETVSITALTGFAHTASTILLGLLIGLGGFQLSQYLAQTAAIVAPLILTILGLIYLIRGVRNAHHHHHILTTKQSKQNKSKFAILGSLIVAMFFSPCLEIEAYYFVAGTFGWQAILIVSAVYLVVTVLGMIVLVDLGCRGLKKMKFHFLEHYEQQIIGVILIISGIVAYFVGN